MKWTHTTGLLATASMIAAGTIWAGCSGNGSGNDGGTDGGGNDVNNQQDTAGNDTGSNDSSTGVDASALNCTYYCGEILSVCGTSNNQYKDMATCMSMCANIPNEAGAGATSGDSLACRMYHLSVAAMSTSNMATHCPHAGPYGYGVCGTLCDNFCQQDFAAAGPCAGDNYPGNDVCHTYCNGADGADAAAGAPGNSAGTPAMLCREYHLENAYAAGGTGGGHCAHAGEDGGGVCP